MINLELIKTLYPCKDRLDNYIMHYEDKSFTKKQFMGLKNISHADKLWVAFRLMTKKQRRLVIIGIVKSILPIFEKQYPNNKRPRQALEAIKKGKVTKDITDAVYTAAFDTYYITRAAANAAYAIYYAAYSYIANAAAYSYIANAIIAAHYAIIAAKNKLKQEKLIRTIILKHWK